MQTIIRKVKHGAIWITGGYISTKVFSYFVNIVFARLLFPDDFGIYAQSYVIANIFLDLSSLGIDSFIVYKQEKAKDYINSGFTLSLFFNIILFLSILSFSPLISKIYFSNGGNHNAFQIQKIIMTMSILYLIQPFRTISLGILTKNMEFNYITKSNIISNLVSGIIAVIIAINGGGVWTLVFYNVMERITNTIAMLFYSKVKIIGTVKGTVPLFSIKRGLSLLDTIKQFKEILNYGIYIIGSALIWYIILNMDIFLIGKYLGSYSVGIYSFTMKQATVLISTMGIMVAQLTFPAFASLQNNRENLQKAFIKTTRIMLYIGIPLTLLMVIFAKDFILIIFGEKWTNAIIPFKILAIGLITRLLFGHSSSLIKSLGRTDIDFKFGIITLPLVLIAIFLGLKYGIIGVSLAIAIVYFILSLLIGYVSMRLINLNFKNIFNL